MLTPSANDNLTAIITGMNHLFDGYAVVSKLRFEGGKVFGSQRYVGSKARR